jgi:hypothetical protein
MLSDGLNPGPILVPVIPVLVLHKRVVSRHVGPFGYIPWSGETAFMQGDIQAVAVVDLNHGGDNPHRYFLLKILMGNRIIK